MKTHFLSLILVCILSFSVSNAKASHPHSCSNHQVTIGSPYAYAYNNTQVCIEFYSGYGTLPALIQYRKMGSNQWIETHVFVKVGKNTYIINVPAEGDGGISYEAAIFIKCPIHNEIVYGTPFYFTTMII